VLNLTKHDLEIISTTLGQLEEITYHSGDWIPTIILVNGNEKVVLSYGESGDPCITEAYDVEERFRNMLPTDFMK
jgi:hypothetical protein